MHGIISLRDGMSYDKWIYAIVSHADKSYFTNF